MSNICVALRRPLREPHPEEAAALAAKADLPTTGVAVDEYARLTNKKEASKLYEASPWAAEIVRPAPVQSADDVPPKSLPRDMAFAKLQSRIFGSSGGGSGCEATRWKCLRNNRHDAQCAGTWLARVGRPCTSQAQKAQWMMATALRLGATPDAGPRSTCVLQKGNDGHMCEQSLGVHPFHPFCCKYEGARTSSHRAVQHTLRRLIEQASGNADMERYVPELYDWVQNNNEAAPEMRCAILDVVSWFPGVLKQLWIDVSVRCPHAERYNESASKTGDAAAAGETEKTKRYSMAVRSLVFETYGRLGGEGHQVAA